MTSYRPSLPGVILGCALVALAPSTLGGCGGDEAPAAAPTATPAMTATRSPSATATSTATALSTATAALATATPPPLQTETPALPDDTPTMAIPPSTCDGRSGGAVITFAVCKSETLAVWSTVDAFIDEAIALLASGGQRVPAFGALLDGADCDPVWTWHPAPGGMNFADAAIELCDGCPSDIEADKDYWFFTVGQYCPWSARVVAVDDRR